MSVYSVLTECDSTFTGWNTTYLCHSNWHWSLFVYFVYCYPCLALPPATVLLLISVWALQSKTVLNVRRDSDLVFTPRCNAGPDNWGSFCLAQVKWEDKNVDWNENKPIVFLWEYLDTNYHWREITNSILVLAYLQHIYIINFTEVYFNNICSR